MIDALPDDVARLFASERALPAADPVRQAAVRARVWKTLGLGGAPPPGGGFTGGSALIVAAVVAVAGGALLLARHERATAAGAATSAGTAASAGVAAPLPSLLPSSGRTAGGATATPSSTRAAARAPAIDWMGQLDVAPRTIDGVVTLDGKPLPGADVTLASASTGVGGAPLLHATSDDDGRFHFAEQPAWLYLVVAERTGLTAATAPVDLRQPGSGEVTLVLAACKTRVRGAITDVRGGAIGNARVTRLESPWHGASTTSDANGEYALCVPAGRARLRLVADGHATQDRLVDVGSGGAIVDAALAPENVVVGTVLGPDGAPRGGAQVNLWHDAASGNGADAHAVTDENGRFEILGVAAGRYGVNAWTRDAITWTPYRIDVVDALVEPLTLHLDATAQIRGVVVRDRRPLAGADVVATRDGSADLRSHRAISQSDGSFTLDGVPEGDVAIVVDGKVVLDPLHVGGDGLRGLFVDAAGR